MGFYKNLVTLGSRFDYPRLHKVCIAAVTYTGDGSDVESWNMAPFKDGTQYFGRQALEFLCGHEVVVLQHWSRGVAAALRARGVKVLLWAAIEAIEPNDWQGRDSGQKVIREWLWRYMLLGTDGLPVNVYDGTARTAWATDISGRMWQDVDALVEMMLARDFADGFFIDSMMEYSYFGTAKHAPAQQYRTPFWQALVKGLRRRVGIMLWGNTVGPDPLPYGLDMQFAEQYFYGQDVDGAVRNLRADVCLNPQRTSWGTATERWTYLAHGAAMGGVRDVWVCTAWTGQHKFIPVWRQG